MTESTQRSKSSHLKVNKECPPDKEINILLLGQTGIGKTTFINSFANYLVNNTLDEAIDGEIKIIIPTSFSFTDPETFEEKLIQMGSKKNCENVTENGQSSTQQCRSFVFPIGDRNLRLIDTPGMGDTRGSEQDNKNLFEILTYISHYEHLNGICIFLKPNEERLTITFRLCIKQILHYLHSSASENIIFIFTNARATLYSLGNSKTLLKVLLDEQQDKNQLQIPLSRDNTFLLDNEPFRYLVLHKNGIKANDEQMASYKKSWDHTIKEYERLIVYISERPLHAIANTLSLNEAEQLIRKLSRPIAETLKLIQQNIQLAREFKEDLVNNKSNISGGLFQDNTQIVPLPHPRLVCTGKNCSRIFNLTNEKNTILYRECQEISYLGGVIQESINDPRIVQCEAIDHQTGKCTKCSCSWKNHMNITYENHSNLMPSDINNRKNGNQENQSLLSVVDKHISDLQQEQATIENSYKKLSKFLHINAIHPCNNDILDYLRLFIREEQMKQKSGIQNDDVINGLTQIMKNYEDDRDAFEKILANEKDSSNATDLLKADDVFLLVGELYRLPINGTRIRYLINILKISEDHAVRKMESRVKLPEKAALSNLMCKLKDVISSESITQF